MIFLLCVFDFFLVSYDIVRFGFFLFFILFVVFSMVFDIVGVNSIFMERMKINGAFFCLELSRKVLFFGEFEVC